MIGSELYSQFVEDKLFKTIQVWRYDLHQQSQGGPIGGAPWQTHLTTKDI